MVILANRLVAAFNLILALIVGIAGLRFSLTSEYGPGPGFWPAWLSVAWLVLSVIWLKETYGQEGEKKPFFDHPGELKRIVVIMAIFLLYLVLLSLIGFLPGTLVYVFINLYLFEKHSLVNSIANGIGLSAGFYLLFCTLLKVDLPRGFLNF